MAYTTIDKPSDHFNNKIYTGNASSQSFTGVGFQPDWVWIKRRGSAEGHSIFDSVRGVQKRIVSNNNEAELTFTTSLTAFNSDGFTLGGNDTVNGSDTYVAWNWKAGTSFTNDASSTGIGTIDSTGSANDTAGFSICSYTGTGSVATIKHGLSTVPNVIITKSRANNENWGFLHSGINTDYWTDYLILNTSASSGDSAEYYNDTAPTSSIFTVGTADATNDAASMISYIFSERKGYSKFGSYTGNNNAEGPFIYTGFKPAFVLIKNTADSADWTINDTARDPGNVNNLRLFPNTSGAENSGSNSMDMLSNGFKLRSTDGGNNGSSHVMIYMAFAEAPLVASNFVPATAR